jgi:hypothetical protein
VYIEMRQKLARAARIFGGYQVDFFEDAHGAERNILEITDRCADNV